MPDTTSTSAVTKRILFADEDRRLLDFLRLGLSRMASEWEMEFVGDYRQAFEQVTKTDWDAVVVDLAMGGWSGVKVLIEARRRLPHALRVAISGYAEGIRLKAPAHQFLPKPFSPETLREHLQQVFNGQNLLGNSKLKDLLAGMQALPVLPSIYLELMEELRAEEPSLYRVGEMAARDQGISTKLLQLVNSPFFGLSRTVSEPVDAALYLGVDMVKAVILPFKMFAQCSCPAVRGFSQGHLWSHSWDVAMLAKRICGYENMDEQMGEEAFLAGLLHDVGILIYATNFPENFKATLELAERRQVPFWQAEDQIYNATHAELGAYLVNLWGISPSVVEAVCFHHRPSAAPLRGFSVLTAVHAANAIIQSPELEGGESQATADLSYLQGLGMKDRLREWKKLWQERDEGPVMSS